MWRHGPNITERNTHIIIILVRIFNSEQTSLLSVSGLYLLQERSERGLSDRRELLQWCQSAKFSYSFWLKKNKSEKTKTRLHFLEKLNQRKERNTYTLRFEPRESWKRENRSESSRALVSVEIAIWPAGHVRLGDHRCPLKSGNLFFWFSRKRTGLG